MSNLYSSIGHPIQFQILKIHQYLTVQENRFEDLSERNLYYIPLENLSSIVAGS
jgi:hypothetical protein